MQSRPGMIALKQRQPFASVKRCTRDDRHEFADASRIALKDCVLRKALTLEETGSAKEIQTFNFEEEKTEALQRIRKRLRVLGVLAGLFALLVIRSNRRRRQQGLADRDASANLQVHRACLFGHARCAHEFEGSERAMVATCMVYYDSQTSSP